ncbi:hypothetical protein JCM8097_004106 [Rhodosporidiobolus ruineniae]
MSTRRTLPRWPEPLPLTSFLRSLIPPISPASCADGEQHLSQEPLSGIVELLERQEPGPMPLLAVFDDSLALELERQMLDHAAGEMLGGTGDGHVSPEAAIRIQLKLECFNYGGRSYSPCRSRFESFLDLLNNVRTAYDQAVSGESEVEQPRETIDTMSAVSLPSSTSAKQTPGQPQIKRFVQQSDLLLTQGRTDAPAADRTPLVEIGFFAMVRQARVICLCNQREYMLGYLLPDSSSSDDSDSGYSSSTSSSSSPPTQAGYRLLLSAFHPTARVDIDNPLWFYHPPGCPKPDVPPSPPQHDPVPPSLLTILLVLSLDKVDESRLKDRLDVLALAKSLLSSEEEEVHGEERMQFARAGVETLREEEETGLPTLHNVLDADVLLFRYPGGQVVRAVRVKPSSPSLPPTSSSSPTSTTEASASPPLSLPTRPSRTVYIRVAGPLGRGHTAVAFLVWLRSSSSSDPTRTDDPAPFVLKIASKRAGSDSRVRKEGERLLDLSQREGFEECVVPALAKFEERADVDEEGTGGGEEREQSLGVEERRTRAVVLMRYGGEAADRWSDFTEEERIELFLRLVELHQKHKVLHGSAKPRNAVRFLPVPSSAPSFAPSQSTSTSTSPLASNPRWIDLGRSVTDHQCPKTCYELKDVFEDMQLREKREEVRKKARERGLRW